jgi:hypothetical protein
VRSRTYRAWGQTILLVLVTATFLLIAVLALTIGDDFTRSDPFSIVLYSVIGVGAVLGLWLAVRMGVVVNQQGIRLRAFGRGQFVRWSTIKAIACEPRADRFGFVRHTPVVYVAAHNTEPEPVHLDAMGSYNEIRAQRRTKTLTDLTLPG